MIPNQMRALADAPDVNHWSASARDALRAAADELERLRLSESNATQQRDQLANALRRSDKEKDRLQAAIENAPHDDACVHAKFVVAGWTPQGRCTCWKADAL